MDRSETLDETVDETLDEMLAEGARLYGAGQSAAAAAVYRRARELAPEDPTVRLRLALSIWHGENRGEEALQQVRVLAADYPQAPVFGAEATILTSLGRFDEAAAAARRAVAVDPEQGGAWVDLASAVGSPEAPGVLAELEAVIDTRTPTPPVLRQMHLARARLLRTLGREEAAFDAMAASNAEAPEQWQEAGERRFAERLRAVFSPDLMRRLAGTGHADGRMIFIVGMPRSGTTLLERLLAAHPDVASAGETALIGSLYSQLTSRTGNEPKAVAAALTPATLRAMGSAYLQGIAQRAEDRLRVVDKMPANYLFAPLIRLMFPRAAILHISRHPLDTALSCWEAGFSFGLDYAARFSTLGAAYRLYAETAGAWSALPRVGLSPIRYEDLVSETGQAMADVLAACRLPWNPVCLTPAPGGQIKTASITQARAPVSDRSIGRWRRHADRLAPLIAAMGGMGWVEEEAVRQSHR